MSSGHTTFRARNAHVPPHATWKFVATPVPKNLPSRVETRHRRLRYLPGPRAESVALQSTCHPLMPPFTSISNFFRVLGHLAYHAGAAGLLTVGFLDSTFLIIPFGNDILLIALSLHHHKMVPLYALAATAGSVLGCWLTIWLSGKGGASIRKRVSLKRMKYVQRQVEKRAGWAVAIASVMPPPFPFTAVVAGAAAFDYPRKKLFAIIAIARFVRFSIEGALAIHYGRWILTLAKSETLKYILAPVIVISILASTYSLYGWIEESGTRSKTAKPAKRVPARA